MLQVHRVHSTKREPSSDEKRRLRGVARASSMGESLDFFLAHHVSAAEMERTEKRHEVARGSFTGAEIKRLRNTFDHILDHDEVQIDASISLDLRVWTRGIRYCSGAVKRSEKVCITAFLLADTDRSGRIDFDDFCLALASESTIGSPIWDLLRERSGVGYPHLRRGSPIAPLEARSWWSKLFCSVCDADLDMAGSESDDRQRPVLPVLM